MGASALALLVFQAPLHAQEAPAPAEAPIVTLDAGGGDPATSAGATVEPAGSVEADATIGEVAVEQTEEEAAIEKTEADASSAGEPRATPDNVDPLVGDHMQRLDRFGVISRQSDLGEDILIIDREIKRAESISTLLTYMGIDGFKKTYPELAELMENSPVVLRAELDKQTLKKEIEAAKSDLEQAVAANNAPAPRDDGSSFFELPGAAAAADGRPAPTLGGITPLADPAAIDMAALAALGIAAPGALPAPAGEILTETPEVAPAEPEIKDIPISLREVYGVSDDFTAVIMHGDERIRVRAGDALPNDTVIEFVGEDYIKLKRRGETVRVQIRG
ncbi:hypothetical protein [Defluviimonas salinarum]|uniref:Type IV pilus biogenesis protein PilP n=1 Tax=Defluviimonas salinarum TaxID=2992147 RepID=A0ABT3J4F5_9RHOB|nr:hypothetical protein [Defluviimonas salinarum]MCW3782572.1 hypothetical protein [Defluviimonas salinarum]